MVFGFRREKLYPNMDIPLGAANPAVKQGLSPLPSCPFLGHAASPGPQSWVSVPILCSKRTAGDTDHSEERSRAASSAAHSCEQMPPVGAEASQSSPECSFKDISAAQLSFHLCVFFSPPLLSWSFKTNKVSRTRQRDNHPLIPFPRVSRLFGDSAAAGGTFTEGKAGASHRDNSSEPRAPRALGRKYVPRVLLFSATAVVNAVQSPGPGRAAAPFSVPSLFSHCTLGTGTSARDVFHASVQTQYEMKNSYPRTRPEWIFS